MYEPHEDEFPEESRVKRLFSKTLDTIKRLFPKISDTSRWGNRADYYSLFVALGNLLIDHKLPHRSEKALSKKLNEFAAEVDRRLERANAQSSELAQAYARAIEKGVNDKARRTDRHEALTEVIKPYLSDNR
jgi:hydroxypyruvate isomerase